MSFKAAVAIRVSSSSSVDLTCPSCSKAFLVDGLSTRAATTATFFLGLYGRLFLTESRALFLPFGWERLALFVLLGYRLSGFRSLFLFPLSLVLLFGFHYIFLPLLLSSFIESPVWFSSRLR